MFSVVGEGGSRNAELLESLWAQMQEKYIGPVCVLIENAQHGWPRIPHLNDDDYAKPSLYIKS